MTESVLVPLRGDNGKKDTTDDSETISNLILNNNSQHGGLDHSQRSRSSSGNDQLSMSQRPTSISFDYAAEQIALPPMELLDIDDVELMNSGAQGYVSCVFFTLFY